MNVLITGGAGYIGSVLARKLLDGLSESLIQSKFTSVTVYDNLLHRQTSLVDLCYRKDFEFIHGDVRDKDKLLSHISKADVIIPLAAIVGAPACKQDKELATRVNYDQIQFIVNNTSKNQFIVYPNTNSGYGIGGGESYCTEESPLRPISHYGKTKVEAENLLLDSGRATTFRLATVFGVSPRMRIDLLVNDFTYKAVNDGCVVLFEKDFKRNYIHIQDVSNVFIFAIENLNNSGSMIGEAYNVGLSSANLSKWELCQKIKEYVPKFSIQTDEFEKDPDQRNYIVSNEKIESLGWMPQHSLDDGIQELIKAYKMVVHSNRRYTNL